MCVLCCFLVVCVVFCVALFVVVLLGWKDFPKGTGNCPHLVSGWLRSLCRFLFSFQLRGHLFAGVEGSRPVLDVEARRHLGKSELWRELAALVKLPSTSSSGKILHFCCSLALFSLPKSRRPRVLRTNVCLDLFSTLAHLFYALPYFSRSVTSKNCSTFPNSVSSTVSLFFLPDQTLAATPAQQRASS